MSQVRALSMPVSPVATAASRKPMLPATIVPVSIERIMPMPASVIATSTMSAISSTTPRSRRAPIPFPCRRDPRCIYGLQIMLRSGTLVW